MKNIIIFIVILFGFNACTSPLSTHTTPNIKKKSIVIDLDEEFSILQSIGTLRNNKHMLLDNPIYIGDNDEVSFKGDALDTKSPISIQIGNNKPISFGGKTYTLKTMEVNNGEMIQMKDKNGNIFLEMEVLKD